MIEMQGIRQAVAKNIEGELGIQNLEHHFGTVEGVALVDVRICHVIKGLRLARSKALQNHGVEYELDGALGDIEEAIREYENALL